MKDTVNVKTTRHIRPTKRTLRDCLVAALIGAGVTFGLGGIYIARANAEPVTPGVEVCTEDDPCWTPLHGNGTGLMHCAVRTENHQVVELSDCRPVADLR